MSFDGELRKVSRNEFRLINEYNIPSSNDCQQNEIYVNIFMLNSKNDRNKSPIKGIVIE